MLTATLTRSEAITNLATVIRDNRPGMPRATAHAVAHRLSSLGRLIRRGRRGEQIRPLTLAEDDRISDLEQEALELVHSLGADFDLWMDSHAKAAALVLTFPGGQTHENRGIGWIIP